MKTNFVTFIIIFSSFFVSCSGTHRTLTDNTNTRTIYEGFHTVSNTDGCRYTGNFNNGLYSGKGKLTLVDGTVYEGEFRGGDFISGTAYYTTGTTYTGYFNNNKWNGKGILQKINGDFFLGTFNEGSITGYGEYYNADEKTTIEGHFENGVPHGEVYRIKKGADSRFEYFDDYGNNKTDDYIKSVANDNVTKTYKIELDRINISINEVEEDLNSYYNQLNLLSNHCEYLEELADNYNSNTNCYQGNIDFFVSYNSWNCSFSYGSSSKYDANSISAQTLPILEFGKIRKKCKKIWLKVMEESSKEKIELRKSKLEIQINYKNRNKNRLIQERNSLIDYFGSNKERLAKQERKRVENEYQKKAQRISDQQRDNEAACKKNPSICGCSRYMPCPKGKVCTCAI